MGKQGFRETNWFKLGDIDFDGEDAPVPLPIEDRYAGSVSAEDSKAFGLHTGQTEYVKTLKDIESDDVSMKTLVREMKVNKHRLGIGLAVSLAGIASLVALYV